MNYRTYLHEHRTQRYGFFGFGWFFLAGAAGDGFSAAAGGGSLPG
jgi:hypothetical protein